jgi:hypothetical protein
MVLFCKGFGSLNGKASWQKKAVFIDYFNIIIGKECVL